MFRDRRSFTGTLDFVLATIALGVIGLVWLAALPTLSMTPGEARESRQAPDLPPATALLKPHHVADGSIVVAAPRRALAREGADHFYLEVVTRASPRKEFVTVGRMRHGYATVSGPTIRVGDRVRLLAPRGSEGATGADK